jgi:hypothetical protein
MKQATATKTIFGTYIARLLPHYLSTRPFGTFFDHFPVFSGVFAFLVGSEKNPVIPDFDTPILLFFDPRRVGKVLFFEVG